MFSRWAYLHCCGGDGFHVVWINEKGFMHSFGRYWSNGKSFDPRCGWGIGPLVGDTLEFIT